MEPDAHTFLDRGIAYDHNGDYDRAIEDFTQSIKLKADDPRAFMMRGSAYQHKHEYELAIHDYDQAIKLKPDYAAALLNRDIARRDLINQKQSKK